MYRRSKHMDHGYPKKKESPGSVYTLQLEHGCYYVGWSKCVETLGFRLGHHTSGQGAAWTKLHPPCKVIESFLGTTLLREQLH